MRPLVSPGPDQLLQMYAGMLRVRLFEERVWELFAAGRIPGFLHTSIGQEAVSPGADDVVAAIHRVLA
jgi:acetoin:2,6-dichlorophenolindophenol oxidoreductase subunit alpha